MKNIRKLLLLAVLLFCIAGLHEPAKASAKTYTVTPKKKPCNSSYSKLATYNKYTKQYYMLESYLEKLEKQGGGTLVLKKGTYSVTNTLYVPSNVTIQLKNGTTIKKTTKTGTSKLKSSKTLFELVKPSLAKKKNSVKKYSGSKNISIIGNGKAYINMSSSNKCIGIVSGHNNKVTIKNVQFKNMKGGSFLSVGGSKGITVQNCKFSYHKDVTGAENQYAIRLEVPDSTTKAFSYKWCKQDDTTNTNITINGNEFKNLQSAIGSVKYAQTAKKAQIYQNNIKIHDNTFKTIDSDVISALNWSGTVMKTNTFNTVNLGNDGVKGISLNGCVNPTVQSNTFDFVAKPIEAGVGMNTGDGSTFDVSPSNFSSTSITALSDNNVTNTLQYFVPYNNGTNVIRLAYFVDKTTKDYVIEQNTGTFRNHFTDESTYNINTEDYYVFKSFLEQLELVGGGTLTVKAGVYSITNTVYVPSNVTIVLENGVTINKGTVTGVSDSVLPPSQSMFQFVPPSKSLATGSVGGYNGSQNIKFIGQGSATIDSKYFDNMKTIVIGHCQNILVQGVNFKNYFDTHFIELNSSNNVVVENCTFKEYQVSPSGTKEAINIDGADANTGGFNQVWSNQDRTMCSNVTIQNNTFENLEVAVGTHKYSVSATTGEQLYHVNIKILNNIMNNFYSDAIRTLNWKDCVIEGNTISNVQSRTDDPNGAILLRGTVNPTIKGNTFQNMKRSIHSKYTISNSGSYSEAETTYAATKNILNDQNLLDMKDNKLEGVTENYARLYHDDGTAFTQYFNGYEAAK